MVTIVIMFRDGRELRMKCEEFNIKRNGLGQLTHIEYSGGTENCFLWLDVNQIMCIYRVGIAKGEVKE